MGTVDRIRKSGSFVSMQQVSWHVVPLDQHNITCTITIAV